MTAADRATLAEAGTERRPPAVAQALRSDGRHAVSPRRDHQPVRPSGGPQIRRPGRGSRGLRGSARAPGRSSAGPCRAVAGGGASGVVVDRRGGAGGIRPATAVAGPDVARADGDGGTVAGAAVTRDTAPENGFEQPRDRGAERASAAGRRCRPVGDAPRLPRAGTGYDCDARASASGRRCGSARSRADTAAPHAGLGRRIDRGRRLGDGRRIRSNGSPHAARGLEHLAGRPGAGTRRAPAARIGRPGGPDRADAHPAGSRCGHVGRSSFGQDRLPGRSDGASSGRTKGHCRTPGFGDRLGSRCPRRSDSGPRQRRRDPNATRCTRRPARDRGWGPAAGSRFARGARFGGASGRRRRWWAERHPRACRGAGLRTARDGRAIGRTSDAADR